MATKTKAGVYVRISHADGEESDEALKLQRQKERCIEKVDTAGWELIEVFEDNGFSGWDPKIVRPAFERMKQGIADGAIDVVVAISLDRLSRRTVVAGELSELCKKHGAVIHVLDLGELGGLQLDLMAALARAESENISRRLGAKYDQTFAAGRPKPGKGGYGYNLLKEPPYYEEVPHEAEIIRGMAKRLLAGENLASIVAWANEDEANWPRPFNRKLEDGKKAETRRPWTIQSVESKLKSPRIAGYVRRNDWIAPGCWIGEVGSIIPFSDWKQISEKLGQRIVETDEGLKLVKVKGVERRFDRKGLLSGFLFTQDGQRMIANTTTARKRPDGSRGQRYEVYEAPDGSCAIQRDYLDEHVFEMFEQLEGNMPKEDADLEREQNETELERATARLAKLEDDYYLGDGPSEDRYRELRSELVEKIDVLQARVAVARESIWRSVGTWRLEEFDYDGATLSIRPSWEQASLEERRALLRSRIQRIIITSDKDAIAKVRGDMSDYEWRQVKDKTKVKTRARTWLLPVGENVLATSWDGDEAWTTCDPSRLHPAN